jgi:hypothetical protein
MYAKFYWTVLRSELKIMEMLWSPMKLKDKNEKNGFRPDLVSVLEFLYMYNLLIPYCITKTWHAFCKVLKFLWKQF